MKSEREVIFMSEGKPEVDMAQGFKKPDFQRSLNIANTKLTTNIAGLEAIALWGEGLKVEKVESVKDLQFKRGGRSASRMEKPESMLLTAGARWDDASRLGGVDSSIKLDERKADVAGTYRDMRQPDLATKEWLGAMKDTRIGSATTPEVDLEASRGEVELNNRFETTRALLFDQDVLDEATRKKFENIKTEIVGADGKIESRSALEIFRSLGRGFHEAVSSNKSTQDVLDGVSLTNKLLREHDESTVAGRDLREALALDSQADDKAELNFLRAITEEAKNVKVGDDLGLKKLADTMPNEMAEVVQEWASSLDNDAIPAPIGAGLADGVVVPAPSDVLNGANADGAGGGGTGGQSAPEGEGGNFRKRLESAGKWLWQKMKDHKHTPGILLFLLILAYCGLQGKYAKAWEALGERTRAGSSRL